MRPRWLRTRTAERAAFVLKTGRTVVGWLDVAAADGVLVRLPEIYTEGGDAPARLSGEMFIPAENIDFVQFGTAVPKMTDMGISR